MSRHEDGLPSAVVCDVQMMSAHEHYEHKERLSDFSHQPDTFKIDQTMLVWFQHQESCSQ